MWIDFVPSKVPNKSKTLQIQVQVPATGKRYLVNEHYGTIIKYVLIMIYVLRFTIIARIVFYAIDRGIPAQLNKFLLLGRVEV